MKKTKKTKINQKSVYNVKKSHLFAVFGIICAIFLLILLSGCAKTAPETATDALLTQINAVEQQIKKECPQVKIDEDMNALRASAKSQLKTCEARVETVQAQRNTWVVISGGLILVALAYFLGKSKKII